MAFFAALSTVMVTGPLVSASPAAAGQIFYVSPAGNDANPGTQDTPWRTIGKAARTLLAGDTALLMDGTYTEPEIQFRNSGTATMPITVRAQNKHQAILSSTSGCRPNISIYASYVTIEDIRSIMDPSNVPCARGHNSADGTGVVCWEGIPPHPANPSTTYHHCVVRGLRIDASSARSHAVKTRQDYALVENCEVYMGLEAFNSYGVVYRNNVIHGVDAWGNPLLAKGGARSFQAYNNVVHIPRGGESGIILGGATGNQFLYDPPSGIEAYNSIAYNNVVLNETGGSVTALHLRGAKDSAAFNNVVIGGSLALSSGPAGVDPINPTFKNNILSCSGKVATGSWNYTGTLSVDYNNFYNCSGPPSQTHPITGDPLLINPRSDWHLASGSPAIQSGTTITVSGFKGETLMVNKDKDGNVRSAPWSLGIYATNAVSPDTALPASPINLRVQ